MSHDERTSGNPSAGGASSTEELLCPATIKAAVVPHTFEDDLTPSATMRVDVVYQALRGNSALVRRSLTASLVVGTVLVMINQGPALLNGDFHHALTWRIPLNYVVPFLVATWGALGNRRG